ncbi:MAG TPA: D-alanyl-D-alanine carboxypeptidase family protein [Methylovirgula sp.]|nr:D-alanyl-D-alanine carboxypeptidase family protein [Methylovirgula sp.]
MYKRRVGRRSLLVSLSVLLSLPPCLVTPAQAHHRHRHYAWAFHRHHFRAEPQQESNIAAIVVDGNSGRVLYARNENDLRHPASITKVMTLYLLFEQLEKGRLRLDSRIPISRHAAAQAPTKLGLHPGATISVDNAIKAVVTLSANDIAVAIAEAIGGDEENFAAMMTREAHALGMTRTRYVNASGLPDDRQITTAADLALLGRAIQERFPRYYHYFSTEVFTYNGIPNRNHNHLLGRIAGMDGIKTGYTRESGFNLLTSVKRNGHYIVAAVIGGATAASRDRIMAGLIENEIGLASTQRTAPMIAEVAAEMRHDLSRAIAKPVPIAAADPSPIGSLAPMPRPRPAFVSGAPLSLDINQAGAAEVRRVAYDGSTERASASATTASVTTPSTTTPSPLRWVTGPAGKGGDPKLAKPEPAKTEPAQTATAEPAAKSSQEAKTSLQASSQTYTQDAKLADPPHPVGWMIQIGATDDAAKAAALLERAKARKLGVLDDAQAFTEKVQKGDETLYRARFAGLDADDAETACRSLRKSGFACFATKN